jgi:hypothetical protein
VAIGHRYQVPPRSLLDVTSLWPSRL